MIIPTPEYDPLFADDGVPFREKMVRYIRREYADLLGQDPELAHRIERLESPLCANSRTVMRVAQRILIIEEVLT
jgi:hypothetical protein